MIIFPAIDILNSRCVRLKKGDYSDSKTYSESPLLTALEFRDSGAKYLHIVDLDAAKTGIFTNDRIIESIIKECDMKVQVGGGVRTTEAAERYFDIGVNTVVVGTAAIRNFEFLETLSDRYPERVCLALDCANNEIKTDGWQKGSGIQLLEFLRRTENLRLASILATDIDRDGMLSGPAFDLYREMKKLSPHKIIASGGISSEDDVLRLEREGLDGAVIGKAIYEGKVDLKKLLFRRNDAS